MSKVNKISEITINFVYNFENLCYYIKVEKIALTTNTEDASNDEFSVSFGLSSLKGVNISEYFNDE